MYIFSRSVKNKHLEKFDLSGLYLQIVLSSFDENGIEKNTLQYSTFSAAYSKPKIRILMYAFPSHISATKPISFDLRATSICPNNSKSQL